MTRDYKYIEKYLDELVQDIYGQPEDTGHTEMAMDVYNRWFLKNPGNLKSVLDVGCGDTALLRQPFLDDGVAYTGVALGTDNPHVINMDFSFLDFTDGLFDCIISRHSLEHSPMPLLTLMEWYRVSKSYLCLVMPNPTKFGYVGKNHYAVMPKQQIKWLLRRAGWGILDSDYTDDEFRFLCCKLPVVGYEGYAKIPLSYEIYKLDIDES